MRPMTVIQAGIYYAYRIDDKGRNRENLIRWRVKFMKEKRHEHDDDLRSDLDTVPVGGQR